MAIIWKAKLACQLQKLAWDKAKVPSLFENCAKEFIWHCDQINIFVKVQWSVEFTIMSDLCIIFQNWGKTTKMATCFKKIFQANKKCQISWKWNYKSRLSQIKLCLLHHNGFICDINSKVLLYHRSSWISTGVKSILEMIVVSSKCRKTLKEYTLTKH